jgi:hypothetical protein
MMGANKKAELPNLHPLPLELLTRYSNISCMMTPQTFTTKVFSRGFHIF